MSYHLRNYRHRNPKGGEDKKGSGPFFQSSQGAQKKGVQRKKKDGAFFQPKLAIGQPDSIQEKEADATAGKMVQRLATSKEDEKLSTHDARMEKDKEEPMKPVQKKGKPDDKKEEEKKTLHKKDAPDKKKKKKKAAGAEMGKKKGGMVHKKEKGPASGGFAPPEVAAEIKRQSGKGSPLPAGTLAEMNKSFGTDFSQVRIHYDSAAARLCEELNAQAFTHGTDIFFNEGKYNPESTEGKLLLAHELTHVVQQREPIC